MKKLTVLTFMLLLCLLGGSVATAQDIGDNVSVYTSVNGSKYLQPLADAFGANLNSGFFHTAKIKKIGLSLEVGIKMMYAPIPASKKLFTAVEEEIGGITWTPVQGTKLATVFGAEGKKEIQGQNGISFTSPGGAFDSDFFPLAVPQLTIGSIFGTELTIRYITYKLDEEFGEIKLSGWGLRHNISQYIPFCPLDIAVSYYNQSFELGDVIDAGANFYGVQASKKFSILTIYGGFGYEKSSLDISYSFEKKDGTKTKVAFNLDGENRTRITAGFALDFWLLKIHADYNMAATNVISAGVGLGF